ncbi:MULTISPECIES: GtrA family protein [unclassified Enterococcus]|uniref:GtrA family protein n=1 Tax=unclassified Enterococcus TaxID=2608891 RepID=UPI001553DBBB|nr:MULTISPECIES: GtrA family protein [unclassified Enterococcus]MBS7577513.1 GtrA family protein [Enterococcus sp. MMGLQ5-2]MBS7584988.1 GtrA family protein [Enterococcus sp. MMGLQ5-1]NPD12843.1 GtrA family protein [Enterococcus sp. MMGLQ5-1]NPD37346.1 GtrA family protein [Enterococcus sp. MMGLQ5-2]
MKTVIKRHQEVILYLFFGGLTTLVNLISYSACRAFFDFNYQISTIIAWFLSVLFAYLTNKLFVFNRRDVKGQELVKEIYLFYVYRVISLLMEMLILFIFFKKLQLNEAAVKISAQIIVILANYIFSKYLIFFKRE